MKLTYNIFYTIVAGLLFLSCSHIEEVEPEQLKPVEKVQMTLTAHMDMEESMTKTYLAGEPIASARNTYWLPTDEIGVLGVSLSKFTNSSADTSAVAVFEGKSELVSQYYAIYPYEVKAFQNAGNEKLVFNIPDVQKYQKNTFSTDVVPMVTKFKAGEELYFKNACGGLVIKVKGTEKIKSMRLVAYEQTGKDAKIAGPCLVDMNAGEYMITPQSDASTSISIDCGSGVQLRGNEPVAFHFALAPATYHGFRVVMMSDDGKFMVKETDKELNIKRANITYAAPFAFEESESVDLSLRGTSNCYIISEANRYRFNASVIGNGTCGIIPDASFHTSDPSIKPVSAEVLWECSGANIKAAEGEILSDVILKDGYVHFTSTGKEGNALIAVKDTDGNILWSWHIWVTDKPLDQTYVNSAGTFVMQDRNLGAVRADQGSGDEYQESQGLLYQWGRKDPFSLGNLIYRTWSSSTSSYSVQDIIKMPFALSVSANSYSGSSNWTNQNIIDFWSENAKTIYDPCPVGYKVSSSSVWSDLTDLSKIQSSYDRGLMVKYNATEYSWYPFTYYNDRRSSIINQDGRIQIWSCDQSITNQSSQRTAETSMSYDKNNHSNGLTLSTGFNDVYALSVRCMKDDGFVDLAMPTVEMLGAKDVTTESATLSFDIINEGASEVTDAGIIYGTTSGLSLANGTKIPRMGEENSVEVTGLNEGTRYYAVAYATNSYGTAYSKEIVFYTEFANFTNLSGYGTSNCYIVSEYGAYMFDASVIGNGVGGIISDASFHTKNPTISPASVEVLWETKGTNVKAEKGELLYNVVLKDGFVHFISTGVEGNALVAVKGAKGSTIWSWHLWFTDSPSEHKYVNSNGSYIVMDRNLGAIRADRGSGDEWKESYGTIYQWGRKDPFIKETYELMRSTDAGKGPFSLSHAIQNPTKIGVMNGGAWNHPSWLDVKNDKLWSNSVKTIYDPCPVGYMVPDTYIWKGFTIDGEDASFWESINASDIKDHGFDFIYDGVNSAWYPAAPMVDWNGGYSNPDKIGRLWTTVPERSFKYETSPAITFNNTECWENYAIPVRCVKDEGYVDISYPQVIVTRFEDITSSSVKVVAEVKSEGISEVTERGIIWGTTEDLSDGIKVACESAGGGSFMIELNGLTNATKYYVRSYAVNSRGESQSAVKDFRTWNSDDKADLSARGASNCYIVSFPGKYRFIASVKGNSDEPIATAVTQEVLWETISCTSKAESGTIISSVKMDGEYVEFIVPSPLQEGNSVIAVKDMSGNILWSWHIWVTDQPQEQLFSNSTGDYYFLDRNLGATRADRGTGDEWRESVGALYQWGRKDPFIKGLYRSNMSIKSVENSILHPTDHASLNSWNYSSYWESNNNKSLWTPDSKTMYDPCPPGYTVADIDAYYEISVDSEFNKGYDIHLASTDSWFPITPIIWCEGSYLDASSDITLWSSRSSSSSFCRLQIPRDDKQYWLSYDNSAMASPVRCMRDNN